jgi:hypothetical protein
MKKLLLFLFAVAVSFAQLSLNAQQGSTDPAFKVMEYAHPGQMQDYSAVIPGQKIFDNTVIGNTWYDAQTINYGNIMPRMWAYEDGTIGTSWVCSGEGGVPDRGIGYNYYNGTEWGSFNPHLGPGDRHGTVCYAPWGETGEIACTYQYIAGEGPILFFKREVKGEGDWIQTSVNGPEGTSIVWQSMGTSGENHEYIHLLAYTYDAEVMGQTNALLYYRSNDGGESWDPDGIIIDGLGIDYLESINALSYTFSNAVGNTIAFTYGFDQWGGWVFKSTDNGENWDQITVMESPYDPLDPPTEAVPAFGCGIGSSAIALDSDGKAHVVFARMMRSFTPPDWGYFPWTSDGLIYWNEDMDPLDSTIISTTGLENLEDGGYLCGYVFGYDPEYGVEVPIDQPDYANAMCGFPVISIDEQDNIFIASSNFAPDYMAGDFFYRHIIANSSFDGGLTWNGMVDLNDDIQFVFSECAFPAMAPIVDNDIYFLFQEDPFPGTYEWPNEQAEPSENNMYFMTIPKSVFVGIEENEAQLNFEISDPYPNPAYVNTMINLRLETHADVTVTMLNMVGQAVKTQHMGGMIAGDHRLTIDVSGLRSGLYYCNIQVDGQSASRKVVVQ